MISNRANAIDSSGIRKVFDLGAKLKDPINLSIGSPAFDASAELKAATIRAIESGKNGYTQTQGISPLIQKVKEKYGVTDDSQKVFITSGVSGGLLLSYLAVLDSGDEILIPDPFFCMYRDLATLINAVPKYYDTYPHFKIDVEKLSSLITPKTKAIVVNSPGNPTGVALTQKELDEVVSLAKQKNIWLIYDEIYEAYCYDFPHAACFGNYEKTIILNGFSKSHGIPGWRMGFAVGPAAVIEAMLKIQQYSFVCAPSMAQWGLAEVFDIEEEKLLSMYREKRDFIYSALRDKYEVEKPTGAFYIFPKTPGVSGEKFVEKCIENSLLVVPGNVFSTKDSHFRLSFSASMKDLERGAEVLRALA